MGDPAIIAAERAVRAHHAMAGNGGIIVFIKYIAYRAIGLRSSCYARHFVVGHGGALGDAGDNRKNVLFKTDASYFL